MKLLLDAICDADENGGDGGPKYFLVELVDQDIERIRRIVTMMEGFIEDKSNLFSGVKVDWLDGGWYEKPPEGYEEYTLLTDEEPDGDEGTDEEEYHGMRGLECHINARSIYFEGHYKHGSVPYSAWGINVVTLLAAYEMTVEDAPKHISSDDKYERARAKELLGATG